MSLRKHWLRWLIGGAVVVVVLAIGVPYAYIHLFNAAPAKLSLTTSRAGAPGSGPGAPGSGPGASAGPVAGSWTVGPGSVVGYRVNEVLMGQSTTAVGRSSSVTGHMTISGTTVTAAGFSVPMSTIHSDKSQRDAQFDGRIMDVARYPTGTFALTSPIDLAPLPATGTVRHYTAHGRLELHGVTRPVTFTLSAERTGSAAKGSAAKGGAIKVAGDIPVLFSDYGIKNPSFAGFVTTQDHGLLEFLLVFGK